MEKSFQKAANDPPALHKNFAHVFLTPSQLMLEWDMTLEQASEFLQHYESWLSQAMLDAGLDTAATLARAQGFASYNDDPGTQEF